MIYKEATTQVEINEVIAKRWSPRAFDSKELLSKEQITSLCEAARWAPSCYGDEPWRVIVCDRNSNKKAFETAYNCLVEWNRNWAGNSSVLFIFLSFKKFKKNGKYNRWAEYDTGSAAENLCLQASSMGLMAHQMGGFSEDKVRKQFNVNDDFSIMSFIAVGYQAEVSVLNEELQELEKSERKRSPLAHNFFDGSLDKGYI